MASSDTEICNIALGHLGEAPITSLDQNSAAARACALQFVQVRDQVLRSHRWNFAQARRTLSELSDTPDFGWAHQFELPADCLRVLEVNDTEIGDVIDDTFIIEGRRILTDCTSVNLVFIKRVEDVSDFDPIFTEALALKLAIALTESIRGTTNKTEQLTQQYERITAPLARRIDANEGKRRKGLLPMNSLAIRARGGFGACFPHTIYG